MSTSRMFIDSFNISTNNEHKCQLVTYVRLLVSMTDQKDFVFVRPPKDGRGSGVRSTGFLHSEEGEPPSGSRHVAFLKKGGLKID